jgi:hypothetical protein
MGFVAAALLRRRRLSKAEQDQVESILVTSVDPFLGRWTIAERRAALAGYVMRQRALCDELVETTGIAADALTEAESLHRVWSHHLALRRVLRRHRPLVLDRQRALKGLPATRLFDTETALVIEQIGALFGCALQQVFDEAEWQVFFSADDEAPLNGQPCLAPIPGPFARLNPSAVVNTLAFRNLTNDSPTVLAELFRKWTRFGTDSGDPRPDES